jgi:hypothetical protein
MSVRACVSKCTGIKYHTDIQILFWQMNTGTYTASSFPYIPWQSNFLGNMILAHLANIIPNFWYNSKAYYDVHKSQSLDSILSQLISSTSSHLVRFEAFTAVAMKNVVFWDVELCRSCVNRRFGGTYRLHLQGRKINEWETSVSRWLQTAAKSQIPTWIFTSQCRISLMPRCPSGILQTTR